MQQMSRRREHNKGANTTPPLAYNTTKISGETGQLGKSREETKILEEKG